MSQSSFGMVGLGTMGRNLALNIEEHGFTVAVRNLARLPQNLRQAQRDAFGAHTFERVEQPGFMPFDWGLKGE
ncbi:MAG TPA: NAD(P)-binding domain-containing protein [Vicinamibacterales bacterium]|jgi:6-phosphogluconate dehydrogenase